MIPLWVAIVRPNVALEVMGDDGLAKLLASPIAGLDLRLPESYPGPRSEWWRGCERLAVEAVEAGKPYRCHAWVGKRGPGGNSVADAREGERDALAVAEMLGRLSIASGSCEEAFGTNAERDVWAGPDGFANPSAVEFNDSFAGAYYEARRASHLDYLGFSDPDFFYRDRDADGDGRSDDELPDWVARRYRRPVVMAYQQAEAQLRKKLERAFRVWGATHERMGTYLPCGRLDAKVGQVGDERAIKALLRSPPPYLEDATLYVGIGAEGQLVHGHAGHASVAAVATWLRDDSRRAIA